MIWSADDLQPEGALAHIHRERPNGSCDSGNSQHRKAAKTSPGSGVALRRP